LDFADEACSEATLALQLLDKDKHAISELSGKQGPYPAEPIRWTVGDLAPGRYVVTGTITSGNGVSSPLPELEVESHQHDIDRSFFLVAVLRGSAFQPQYFEVAARIDGSELVNVEFGDSSVIIRNRGGTPLIRCDSEYGEIVRLDWLIDGEWDEGDGRPYFWPADLAEIPPQGEAVFKQNGVRVIKKVVPGRLVAPTAKRLRIPAQPPTTNHVLVTPTIDGPFAMPPCDHYYVVLPATDMDPRFYRPLADEAE